MTSIFRRWTQSCKTAKFLVAPVSGSRHPSLVQVQNLALQFLWQEGACDARVSFICEEKKQEVHRRAGNESSPEQVHTLFYVKHRTHPPLTLTVRLNEAKISMEVDTGAAVSLISDTTFKGLWPEASRPPLQPSSVLLRTYTGEQLSLLGQVSVNVSYGGKCHKLLPLLIVRGNGPSLLGRDWVSTLALKLEELSVLHTRNVDSLQGILERHAEVFRDELGLVRGLKVKLHVKDSINPLTTKGIYICHTSRRPRAYKYALYTHRASSYSWGSGF